MNTFRKQRGMTAIGWLIVLGLVAFFALLVLRLTPIYLEHYEVISALESLKSEPYITQKTKPEVKKLLERRFDVNDIKQASVDDVTIDARSGRMTVGIDYEVRVHLLGNIDAAIKFNRSVDMVAN